MPSTPSLTFPRFVMCTRGLATLALLGFSAGGCGGSGGGTPHDGSGGAGGAAADGGTATGGGGGTTSDGGGGTSATCAVGGVGQLVLAVVGLPAGATPMVRVAGAGLAAPLVLTAGTPVSVPARGGYEIQYRRVKVAPAAGGIVGKAYYVSASSFDGCVAPGATATATLTYASEPGSEHMWIGVSDAPGPDDELAGFASADLAATAAKNPAIWKTKNFVGRPGAGAFDSSGSFWVPGGDFINMYAMATLATPGGAAPEVVITLPAASHANFVAFDADGNLWVSLGAPVNEIVRFTPADLAASGSPTPAVVISSPSFVNPAGLAFAPLPSRDLWVASEGNDKVLRFNGEHLSASFSGAADLALTAGTAPSAPVQAAYTAPNGLAFDQTGNLWVGYVSNLVRFTLAQQTQQTATALVAGPIALNIATGTGGFAFDESGGVWVSGGSPMIVRRFPQTALATTGDATPDIVITSSELGYAETIVLDPSPTWSALQDWL